MGMPRTSVALATLALAMGGCATVPPAGYRPQALAVSTHEVSAPRLGWGSGPPGPLEEIRGVECTASNDRGAWATVTPGVLAVERSAARLRITCRRDGYREASVELPCVAPGTQAMAGWGAVYVFPPAMLAILPAVALGAIAAANRDEAEPNYCLYGAGNAVQLLMER